MINNCLENVKMTELFECLDAFSNNSFVDFNMIHCEKHLNKLEMILQETPENLYKSVTYGVSPNEICFEQIGYLTGFRNRNVVIAKFLIQKKIRELKNWLLENYEFSDREIKLLHYFKEKKEEE
jgi:hypothetical protein